MAKLVNIGKKELNLKVTASERAVFENTTEGQLDRRWQRLAAYVPAKETLEKLFEEAMNWEPGAVLKGRSIMLDFCMGWPQLSISLEGTMIYPVSVEWVTNVYREDAIVNAIDMLLGVKHSYVASEWRENSFYEWKI